MGRLRILLFAALAVTASATIAQTTGHAQHHAAPSASVPSGAPMVAAEVRKVDKDARKITLKHGAIKNLDMPAMTMVFQVKDASMLEQVKAGDQVRFAAEMVGGQYTVVRLEAAR
jgi:Cu(I)/Ag(I) efflux system periplasmic protein CusF